ncbi:MULTISPECIES: hypothetical protein [unclassified Burkholderia]|uniref:hypothetical protein n=1 Tax=unclassified Burkholderia TaxID=2613784 RepID=UPI001E5C639F|nr:MULTISPECIES: hypothetical protein [unclassified Burkholderia]UEP45638.1 hypothetical protein LMA02_23290 [Burkholderia sp. B21-005]
MNGTNPAMGLAYSNPYSAAAMAAGQALSSLLGGGGPQTSSNAPFNPFTADDSGWSVNFGSGSANATANPVSTLAQGLAGGIGGLTAATTGAFSDPLVLLAVIGLAVVVMRKK